MPGLEPSLRARLTARLAGFLKDRRGNFGVMTAILMVPLVGVAGMCVDLVRLLEMKEQVQQAADAAVLDAVSASNWNKYLVRNADVAALNRKTRTKAEAVLRSILRSHDVPDGPLTIDSSAGFINRQLRSHITFSYSIPTSFLNVLGIQSLTVSGIARGTSITPRYTSLHILVDNSPSMGIAATADAMKRMEKLARCAFACHVSDERDTYVEARALNIPLRIDTVKEALAELANSVETTRTNPNQYYVSLYTLGATSRSFSKTAATLIGHATQSMPLLREYISSIDLMLMVSMHDNARRMTYLPQALEAMDTYIPASGNGTSQASPEQVLILISDGVTHDLPRTDCTQPLAQYNVFTCQEPLNPKYCEKLKQRGVRIATLYTTYLPIPQEPWYRDHIAPFQNIIPDGLKGCASDGLFFQVDFGQTLEDAIQALFIQAVNTPRITD